MDFRGRPALVADLAFVLRDSVFLLELEVALPFGRLGTGGAITPRRSSARSAGLPWYIHVGIWKHMSERSGSCGKGHTSGANFLYSSDQLWTTLSGHTTRNGLKFPCSRRYALKEMV